MELLTKLAAVLELFSYNKSNQLMIEQFKAAGTVMFALIFFLKRVKKDMPADNDESMVEYWGSLQSTTK